MSHHDAAACSVEVLSRAGGSGETETGLSELLPMQRSGQAGLATTKVTLCGRLQQVDAPLLLLVGAEGEQLVGRPAADLCATRDDVRALQDVLLTAGSGTDGGEARLQLARRDEAPLPVHLVWSLVRDLQGAPSHLRCVWLPDLAAQAADEARWRSLLENAAAITWTADADGSVRWVTPGALDQLGWQAERLAGTCAFDFVHPEEQELFRAAWDRLVSSSSRQEVVECRVRRSDGGWTWMRQTLTDLRDDDDVRAIVGNVADITRLRHERRARVRQETHLRARFEQSRVPQATVDVRGFLVAANDALAALVGQPAAMLLDQPACGLAHATDHGLVDRALAQVLSGELDSAQAEGILIGRAGRRVPVLADLSLLRDEDGQPAGVALFWHDLSRLREAEERQRQQEEFYLALNRRANDLAVVTDKHGCLLYVSVAVQHMLGYDADGLLAADAWEFVHPDDLSAVRTAIAAVVQQGSSRTFEARVRDSSGAWRFVEVTSTNLLDTAVGGIVSNLVDITDRVAAERALRASEARYRAIADTGGEGIWAVSPEGRTLYVNARMAAILGLPQREVYETDALALLDADQAEQMRERLRQRAGRGTEHYELRYRHPDGGERILAVAATLLEDVDGRAEGSLAMVSDVTDARRTEEQLRHAAVHDGLTGLPNRTLLLDRLEHALDRETVGTAVLFIDLDHFKLVNDSRGHGSGDDLLVGVAERLRAAARPADTVARFGGDEFVVICEDVDTRAAEHIAQQLLAALDDPLDLDFGPVHITASVGVAVSPAQSASDLLRFADAAMYAAKAAGRGRVRQFDRSLSEAAERQYALAADLRGALAEESLTLHYQPVIELKSGRVIGMEALARWQHPEHGWLPPTSFVPLAARSGLSYELDSWVLRRALHEAGALRARGAAPADAYIAVNLSAMNLTDDRLLQAAISAAASARVAPADVVLEITEGAIMADTDAAVALLRRLRDHGFQIAMDDFGTGYSSLSYLRELPITMLKIDQSFVAHLAEDGDAHAIAASIVDLARAVGVTVVAEGVETAQQAALLRRLGCKAGQGWLWSTARAAQDVTGPWVGGYAPVDGALVSPPRPHRVPPKATLEHGVERLLALHREGASLATVAAALNAEGFRTPTGVRWHSTSVARTVAEHADPAPDEAG